MITIAKKLFIGLVTGLVSNAFREAMRNVWIINSHQNEFSQKFHYYPFTSNLGIRVGNSTTLNGLCNKVCIPNKRENLNLNVPNIINGINESKTLTKHISRKRKCKFDGRNYNSGQWWNNDNVDVSVKNVMYAKKNMLGNLLHIILKMENI